MNPTPEDPVAMHHDAKHNLRMPAQSRARLRFLSTPLTLAALLLPLAAGAATFTVDNIGDSGPGSLRQAIDDANITPGPDMIVFAIPGSGVHTIQPLTPLPDIAEAVTIDGLTQPGSVDAAIPTIEIEINGDLAPSGSGLSIYASDTVIRGLAITGFRRNDTNNDCGILVEFSQNTVIERNFVGTDASGTVAKANEFWGVYARYTYNTTVRENVISGNGWGGVIVRNSTNAHVNNNRIGTDVTGTAAIGNSSVTPFNAAIFFICDTAEFTGNLVSGNLGAGLLVQSTTNFTVSGNKCGTDITGTAKLSNFWAGEWNYQASHGTISGNLISGTESGPALELDYSDNLLVQNNRLGTNADGNDLIPNSNGLSLTGSSSIQIKGNLLSGAANGYGVNIDDSTNLLVQNNRIGTNADGDNLIPNANGVIIGSSDSIQVQGNLVGGADNGVMLFGSSNVEISSNTLGVGLDGTTPLSNGFGITAYGGSGFDIHDNTLGQNLVMGILIVGTQPGARVEFNDIFGTGASDGDPYDNYAGIYLDDATGASVVGNRVHDNLGDGIIVNGSSQNQFEGNELFANKFGIRVRELVVSFPDSPNEWLGPLSRQNSILGNSIHDNASLGIELVRTERAYDAEYNETTTVIGSGPDINDLLDTDSGPNDFLNHPTLQTAILKDGVLTAKGNLKGLPDSTQTVQVFASSAADPSGYGEGDIYLGQMTVNTDDDGNVHFNLPVDGSNIGAGMFITTTTTDADGNTSEFSNAVVAKAASDN